MPLWRGDHVPVRQLAEDFARYLYLPRLRDSSVLAGAIRDGIGLLTWEQDSFAYAESYDDDAKRYRGLRHNQQMSVNADDAGLLVKPAVARGQLDAEVAPPPTPDGKLDEPTTDNPAGEPAPNGAGEGPKLTRYHGTVVLDPARTGRDAGRIADEVISHLVGLIGSNVRVTLEIEADIPAGASETVVRTVTENARTLKFTNQGFEKD